MFKNGIKSIQRAYLKRYFDDGGNASMQDDFSIQRLYPRFGSAFDVHTSPAKKETQSYPSRIVRRI